MWSTWLLIFIALGLAVLAGVVLNWAIRSGQYDNVEDIKYRILEDEAHDEDSPASARKEI